MPAGLQLFLLGAVHFYSIFFIAKYFEYVYLTFQGLLVLFLIQILSFFSNIWQPWISKHKNYFFFVYVLSLYFLSLSNLSTNIFSIVAASIGIFVFIQSEILQKLKNFKPSIQQGYSIELLGGLCGVALYYLCTATFGFQGFYMLATLIVGGVVVSEFKRPKAVAVLLALLALCFTLQEPQPLVNKRGRYDLLSQGRLFKSAWDPNGHVELITSTALPYSYLLSFEGGALRSNIFEFTGNYEQLKKNYLNSVGTGVWALDVVLPHFLKPNSQKVALISSVGGQEILAAKAFGAQSIDVIEINGSAQKMVAEDTRIFNGDIYSDPVRVHKEDGRHFIENSKDIYDIIQIYSAESASLSSALGSFFRPSSLVTQESLQEYAKHLQKDGVLQITINQYLKMKATFEAAFGEQVFFDDAKMLVLKAWGEDIDLITFLYKKNGWQAQEISNIAAWLKKDQANKWVFLVHPLDFRQQKEMSLRKLPTPETYLRPSTDNWPFLRVLRPPLQTPPIHYLLVAFVVLLAILFIPFPKKSISSFSKYGAFAMGSTYSFAQSILIVQFQKILGQPALGLCLAVGLCLVLTGLAALVKFKKIPFSLFGILSLAFLPIFWGYLPAALVLLSILIFVQGILFVDVMKKTPEKINYIFWFNGLGFSFGLVLFNLMFICFGLWQAVLLLSGLYILVAVICRKNTFGLGKI